MRRPRTLAALALVLLAAGLAVGVPSASAIDPFPTLGVATLSSDNFTVHYSRDDLDTTCSNYITQQWAGDVLGMLERARSVYAGMGLSFPSPVPDTDAHVHVSIDDLTQVCVPYGAVPIGTPVPYSRWDALLEPIAVPGADNIHLDATKGLTYPVIAHEVFHLVEDAMVPDVDPWLQEGSAEWAAVRANQDAGGTEANPDRTLDCVGSECGDTEYDRNGYPGWMLFEYLAERYGDSKVKAVWDQAVANPLAAGTTDLANVLPVSLASFFNDYTTARLTGNFTIPALAGQLPAPYAELPVGSTSGSLPSGSVAVNHLAVRYVILSHGSDTTSPCFAASLTINVGIPAGVASTPYYYAATKGASAQALTVSGSTASITVPWNTCGGSPAAYLSLPNDSLGLDGREFTVGGHVSVDLATPASPTDPPPGVHVIGSVISSPISDPAPTLKVYAPELIRVSTKTHLLRFAVFSSGDGKLAAMLGSTNLGSASLRGGNNDVRFVLPTQLFKSLRTKSSSNLLALTSVSPSGTQGSTVTRRVLVQAPKKKPKRR
ncbi:MAG: hypothetical protein E6G36_00210 [Actinobacteria bacterium]|nr:MAG: hypothetical protein E6G36_00210 [Actinomycetota bacterium]